MDFIQQNLSNLIGFATALGLFLFFLGIAWHVFILIGRIISKLLFIQSCVDIERFKIAIRFVAWRLSLSEVPLLRDVFGLPKRPPKPTVKEDAQKKQKKRSVKKFD